MLALQSQIPLNLHETNRVGIFPSTRYQGSKNKILQWIDYHTKHLNFDTVLDAFGGTGSVAYMFKKRGKQVFYNDYLKFNHYIGLALVENNTEFLSDDDVRFILGNHSYKYPTFISDTFKNVYYTDEENTWLDRVVTNIRSLENDFKVAMAFFALFQSCIIKRPYNLFHRKNLYVRSAHVERSFGNKKTWDTSFEKHFIKFVEEVNDAIFDNGKAHKSYHSDIFDLDLDVPDLVYIDTPYISTKGVGVNYFDFYHFLEGLVHYEQWAQMIDYESKHLKIRNTKNRWSDKSQIHEAFNDLFKKFRKSQLLISYRDDGIPSIEQLISMLVNLGKRVEVKKFDYKYALSNTKSKEVLIIAQ